MAKTNAENLKKWREKHKGEEQYIERRRLARKKHYDGKKLTDSKEVTLLKREAARLRKQKSREAARPQLGSPKKISPAAMGKAVKKALSIGLPKSPRTRKAVISRLGQLEGVELFPPLKPIARARMSADTIAKAILFFESDNVSRVDPGRKTATVVRNRSIEARRYLLHNISETYALFVLEHPEEKIGRSSFAALRPPHVRPLSNIPHNVCVCKIHENFLFIHEVLREKLPAFKSSPDKMLSHYICDLSSYNCMRSACDVCQPKIQDLFNLPTENDNSQINYRQWVMVGKRIEIVTAEQTIGDAIAEMRRQLNAYMLHVFIKTMSQKHFNESRKLASPEIAVLQIDFAENFAAQYQDEVQSAHWGNPQIAIFTGVMWFGESATDLKSYAVVANNITHDRYCVDVFIRRIIEDHMKICPETKTLHVFSDGCAGQFKSRFNFANITHLKQDYNLQLTWTFFATSHGKGAVDGIGAVVKRHVWNSVRSKKLVVRDAEAFAEVCLSLKVHVIYVPSSDITRAQIRLDVDWQDVVAIKGTHKIHHIVAQTPYCVTWKNYPQQETTVNASLRAVRAVADEDVSDDEENADMNEATISRQEVNPRRFAIGNWVVVVYDDQWLPGTVEEVLDKRIRVKFMKYAGPNRFVWPAVDDFDTVSCETVLALLAEVPELKTYSGRGAILGLCAKEFTRVTDLFINTM